MTNFENAKESIDRKTHKYKKSTIISTKSDKPAAAKTRHYVDKIAFYDALVERRALVLEYRQAVERAMYEGADLPTKPKVSDFIGKCLLDIAQNLARKWNFANYPYRDDMVMDAVIHCIAHVDSFDPTKSKNPFSYFTQACYFCFINKIADEKKEIYIKCKSTITSAVMGELSEVAEEGGDMAEHVHDNMQFDSDFMERFVDDFEKKMEKKPKEKVKVKKGLDDFLDGDDE